MNVLRWLKIMTGPAADPHEPEESPEERVDRRPHLAGTGEKLSYTEISALVGVAGGMIHDWPTTLRTNQATIPRHDKDGEQFLQFTEGQEITLYTGGHPYIKRGNKTATVGNIFFFAGTRG